MDGRTRAKSMKIENGQMFWSDVVKRIPALDAFWIKDWIIDLNETLVDDPVGAGCIVIDSVEFDDVDVVSFEGTWYWRDGSARKVRGTISEDDFVFWEVEAQ